MPRGAKSRMRRTETPKPIWIKFCLVVDIPDVVTYTNFGDHRLRGFLVAGSQISPSPIDFHRRPYNTLALPCERVSGASQTTKSTPPKLAAQFPHFVVTKFPHQPTKFPHLARQFAHWAWQFPHIYMYTVIHNYRNPWFLLYSLWINRHKVIKFSTYV